MARGRNVRYISPDGEVWPLHGDGMGSKGIYLTSFAGIYHPQRTPVVLTPAYKRGAIPGPKTDASVIGLKIFTTAETPEEWERVESRWWNSWSDERDGTWSSSPCPPGPRDGNRSGCPSTQRTRSTMSRTPRWTGPCRVSPTIPAGGQLLKASATGSGLTTIKMANPGDMEVWPHFTGQPVPGLKIPDGIGGDLVDIKSATYDPDNGEWLIVTDQMEVVIEDYEDSQIVALLAGLMFQHPIPAETPVMDVPIDLGSTSTTVRTYIEPLYRRPWG